MEEPIPYMTYAELRRSGIHGLCILGYTAEEAVRIMRETEEREAQKNSPVYGFWPQLSRAQPRSPGIKALMLLQMHQRRTSASNE